MVLVFVSFMLKNDRFWPEASVPTTLSLQPPS